MVYRLQMRVCKQRCIPGFKRSFAVVSLLAAACTYMENIGYQQITTDLIPAEVDTGDTTQSQPDTEALPTDNDKSTDTVTEGTDSGNNFTDTGSDVPDTGDDDSDTVFASKFPMIFDFNTDNDGFINSDRAGWTLNLSEGVFSLDIAFEISPDWSTLEYYVGEGIYPGGVDWLGATAVAFRIKVDAAEGGYFRAFIQSIEVEADVPGESETWMWFAADDALVPDSQWRTLTFDLLDPDARLNLEEVTKLGFQIHGPENVVDADPLDTTVQLGSPATVKMQIDSIIVSGVNPTAP